MPINVTCPECYVRFLVGEEFAGRPGRCPECGAVIQVPGLESEEDPPHPQSSIEPFDEFPGHSRRRQEDDRYRRDEQPRGRSEDGPRRPKFDAEARAHKWKRVSNGLRNLMVAVIVLAVQELVGTAFLIADGIRPAQPNNLGPRDQAMIVGTILVWTICLILWALGRIGCARVPYVPARRLAFPAGLFAGMTCAIGVVGLSMLGAGVMIIGQGNLNGLGLANLGVCALMPTMVGFVVAEALGLWSQVKMGESLSDKSFTRTSRTLLVAFLSLTIMSCCAACGLFMALVAEVEKAQQQQQQMNNQNKQEEEAPKKDPQAGVNGEKDAKNKLPPPREVPEPPGKKKEPGAGKKVAPGDKEKNGAAQGQPGNQAPGQQQPANPDPADHPEVVYAVRFAGVLIVLTYAILLIVCCQLGRRAIRTEVEALVGRVPDPHDYYHRDRY